jgi:hypothetical protein
MINHDSTEILYEDLLFLISKSAFSFNNTLTDRVDLFHKSMNDSLKTHMLNNPEIKFTLKK